MTERQILKEYLEIDLENDEEFLRCPKCDRTETLVVNPVKCYCTYNDCDYTISAEEFYKVKLEIISKNTGLSIKVLNWLNRL